tara:strand:+ start:1504 stop:1935 length:432 start_codon:yes stop_codon:yes gene_type:complete
MPPRRSGVREFELRLDQFVEQVVPEEFNNFKKVVALDALKSILMKNPVDTGRSRNNWNVSLGTWSTKVDEEDLGGPAFGQAPDKVVAEGEAVVNKVQSGEDVFIVNNIHYINLLEDGHSEQAQNPNGMVERTVTEIELHYGGR